MKDSAKKLPLLLVLLGISLDLFALVWTFMPGRIMDPVLLQFRGYSKILLIAGMAGVCYVSACFLAFRPSGRRDFFTGRKEILLGLGLFLSSQTVAVLVQYVHLVRHRDTYTMYQALKGVAEANGVYMKYALPVTGLFLALLGLASLIMIIRHGLKKSIIRTLAGGILLGLAQILGLFMARYGSRFGIFINVPVNVSWFYNALFVYCVCMLLAAWICILRVQCLEPEYTAGYVIIPGCGLKKDGTVGTNLARRIDAALTYRDRRRENGLETMIIASGGQGRDEVISEAESMVRYLTDRGEDPKTILKEDNSVSTAENFLYSRELIRKDHKEDSVKAAIASSKFHLFRCGVIAAAAGFDPEGIGCGCPWYDAVSLYFRECMALIWQNGRVHLAAAFVMVLAGVMLRLLYRIHTGL